MLENFNTDDLLKLPPSVSRRGRRNAAAFDLLSGKQQRPASAKGRQDRRPEKENLQSVFVAQTDGDFKPFVPKDLNQLQEEPLQLQIKKLPLDSIEQTRLLNCVSPHAATSSMKAQQRTPESIGSLRKSRAPLPI